MTKPKDRIAAIEALARQWESEDLLPSKPVKIVVHKRRALVPFDDFAAAIEVILNVTARLQRFIDAAEVPANVELDLDGWEFLK